MNRLSLSRRIAFLVVTFPLMLALVLYAWSTVCRLMSEGSTISVFCGVLFSGMLFVWVMWYLKSVVYMFLW